MRLFEHKLRRILAEARKLNPAIITMKRGTIIPVYHHRQVNHPTVGPMIVAGINPTQHTRYFAGQHRPSFIWSLRDFYKGTEWVPTAYQDQDGYHETGGDKYDARRHLAITEKFSKILTMNPNNIHTIQPTSEIKTYLTIIQQPIDTGNGNNRIPTGQPTIKRVQVSNQQEIIEIIKRLHTDDEGQQYPGGEEWQRVDDWELYNEPPTWIANHPYWQGILKTARFRAKRKAKQLLDRGYGRTHTNNYDYTLQIETSTE